MKNETHFNERVPAELAEKVREVAQAVYDDFISDYGRGEAFGCPNINEIYGYHISGFIPSQLGGYEVSELYRCDTDTSYHFTDAQSESVNRSYDYMLECFARDSELPLETVKTWDDLTPEQQNELSEYENEWFEPALLRLEIWVDDSDNPNCFVGNDPERKADSVFIRLSLNYQDAPYYRTKSDETLREFNLSAAEFMKTTPQDIINKLNAKE